MSLSAVKEWKFPVIINSKKEPLTVDDYYAADPRQKSGQKSPL